jgi:methylglutaconyl-CoA hydratase
LQVNFERINAIAKITLDYPERLNALGPEMWGMLHERLIQALDDTAVGVIIITGTGRAFSAGGDISALVKPPQESSDRKLYDTIAATTRLLLRGEKPCIAMINGDVFGAGAGVVASCDLAIAADHVRFGYPEIKIGLLSSITSISLIRSVPKKTAYRWALLGETVTAADALQAGMVNQLVPLDSLEAVTFALAERLCALSRTSLARAKDTLVHVQEMTYDEAVEYARAQWLLVRQSEDCKEGLRAFLERRPPVWSTG